MRRMVRQFGWAAVTAILVPFVINRANSDFERAPLSVIAVLVLFLVCLGQSVAYAFLRQQYIELERRVQPSQEVVNLALTHSVRPIDKDNHYTLIKLFARIDLEGNYRAQYERHGINQSRTAVDHLRVLSCADSNMDFAVLQVEAGDLNSQTKLKVQVVEDNRRQKLFDIYFKKPIQPGESFAVAWSVFWPRVLRAAADYDYIVLKDFERGVDKLSYSLEFEWQLPVFSFERLSKSGGWLHLAEGKEQAQGSSYTYILEVRPDSDAYRFSYRS
jgi:hypothetical protein